MPEDIAQRGTAATWIPTHLPFDAPLRRRLPIYGERHVDAARRVAYDAEGYGAWLQQHADRNSLLLRVLAPLRSVFDLLSVQWVSAELRRRLRDPIARGTVEEAIEQHEDESRYWLRFAVNGFLGTRYDGIEFTHYFACAPEMASLEPPRVGGVYAVEGHPGWVKIGRSECIANRVRDLQLGQPARLRLLAVLSLNQRDESVWHRRWQHLRGQGEWFRSDPELLAAVAAARSLELERQRPPGEPATEAP